MPIKKIPVLLLILLLLLCIRLPAQNKTIDSLQDLLSKHVQRDSNRVNLLNRLALELFDGNAVNSLDIAAQAQSLASELKFFRGEAVALIRIGTICYYRGSYDSAIDSYGKAREIAERNADAKSLAWALNGLGTVYHSQSNYPLALDCYLKSVQQFEKIKDEADAASIMGNVGVLYKEMGELKQALEYFQKGLKIHEMMGNRDVIPTFLNNIGNIYSDEKQFPEALTIYLRCLKLAREQNDKYTEALVLRNLVQVRMFQRDYKEAVADGFLALALFQSLDDKAGVADTYYKIADTYVNIGKPDSALFYAKRSLYLAQQLGFKRNIFDTYQVVAEAHASRKEYREAYEAQHSYILYKDSLTGEENQQKIGGLKFQYELDKKQVQIALLTKDKELQEQKAKQRSQQVYALIIGLFLSALLALALVRNNRQKRRANEELLLQKETITAQRDHLELALKELKSTQQQLIQREKMASLGDLTAGIAHEIQNPLNFVNNFSEVNEELIDEMKAALLSDNKSEALSIAQDIKENAQKINHHGRRADAIVKGMLQHSRINTGHKEPARINALVDEHVRMSYNGFRTKDKSFQASIQTDYDESIGAIQVIPQDIGRVLLNISNNAFYSLTQKKLLLGASYLPVLTVSSRILPGKIEIKVRDNGMGISNQTLGKIFQPFYTTKPSGQGIGLGLSLSYDIIMKGHGGALLVNSREGEYAEFTIELPQEG